jgi:hypothetical protein
MKRPRAGIHLAARRDFKLRNASIFWASMVSGPRLGTGRDTGNDQHGSLRPGELRAGQQKQERRERAETAHADKQIESFWRVSRE